MALPQGSSGGGVPGELIPGKPTNIGNGYVLTLSPTDPSKGWLTTPSKQIIEWREGMTLPGVGGTLPLPAAPVPAASTWGGYPAVGGQDSTAQFYKDQLQGVERRRQDDDRRREAERAEEQRRREAEK